MGIPIRRPESAATDRNRPDRAEPSVLSTTSAPVVPPAAIQLDRFDRSLRESQKLALILRLLGPLENAKCLMLNCGGSSGALSFHLRARGGEWAWAEISPRWTDDLRELLGDPVAVVNPQRLPFATGQFHRVVVLDPGLASSPSVRFSRELGRIVKPHGRLVALSANSRPTLSIRLLRRALDQENGAHRNGSRAPEGGGDSCKELERLALNAGLIPDTRGACSRFFSECMEELRQRRGSGAMGTLGRAIAALDYLVPTARGATVAVAARKPEPPRVVEPEASETPSSELPSGE